MYSATPRADTTGYVQRTRTTTRVADWASGLFEGSPGRSQLMPLPRNGVAPTEVFADRFSIYLFVMYSARQID
jgi:hypothetical protein